MEAKGADELSERSVQKVGAGFRFRVKSSLPCLLDYKPGETPARLLWLYEQASWCFYSRACFGG